MFYVYGLFHPDTAELRYIGKTNNLKTRYRDHINKMGETNRKRNWIKSLINDEKKPIMMVIEELDSDIDCLEAETYYIRYFRYLGVDLINHTDGGEAGGHIPSEETKKKISKAHTGMKHTEETKQKIRKIRTGTKASEETKKKMSENNSKSMLGKKWSDTARKKYTISRKGKFIGKDNKLFGTKKDKSARLKSVNKNTKLSFSQIEDIRCLYGTCFYNIEELAQIYNVGRSYITRIINYTRGITPTSDILKDNKIETDRYCK